MKIEKLKVNVNTIPYVNPVNGKKLNNGNRKEIAYEAHRTGYVNYQLDNKINTLYGDYRTGNYVYQVKSNKCELKIVKSIGIDCNSFEDVLTTYLKYEKANRYVYIIENDNNSYAIIMNTEEFKEFVEKYGTYSNTRKNIRIYKADSIIYKDLVACA